MVRHSKQQQNQASLAQTLSQPYVDVRLFGAVGDDVADDTVKIQNALNATPGGEVWLQANKTYKITAMLDLGLNKSLVGWGRGSSIIHFTHAGIALSVGVPGQAGAPLSCTGKIRNLQINGPGPTIAGSIGIRIIKCLAPRIDDVSINNSEAGIWVDGSDLWVASGLFTNVQGNELKFGITGTADSGKQVNDMTIVGGWIGGPAAAPAGAYGLKIAASCDTWKVFGLAAENYSGAGSHGMWVTSGASVGHRFYGTRTEACGAQPFLLDATATLHHVIGNSQPVTDNGYANYIVEMNRTRRVPRFVSYAAAITPDCADGDLKQIDVLTGAITINNPTNTINGQRLTFEFTQDGVGGRVVTWGSKYLPGSSWVPVTTAGKKNTITFEYNLNFDQWLCTGFGLGL